MNIGKNDLPVERADSNFARLRRQGKPFPHVADAAYAYRHYPADMFAADWLRLRDDAHMWPARELST